MKFLKLFLTLAMVVSGTQAWAFTKGQKVFARAQRGNDNPTVDFAVPYDVIDSDSNTVTVYRRDVGTRQLRSGEVFSEKKTLEKWWIQNRIDDEVKAKLPALSQGSVLLSFTYKGQKAGQPEPKRVSRILQSDDGYVALIFADGDYQWGVGDSYVIDDPKSGLQAVPDFQDSPRLGDVATSKALFDQWHDENSYKEMHTRLVEKVPATKVSALAVRVRYGSVEAVFQMGKTWVATEGVHPLVTSAYGVKNGDTVYANDRFDLRVEQIFRTGETSLETGEMGYDVVLTGGVYVFLNRDEAKKLLSARVCNSASARTNEDRVCEDYRDNLQERKGATRFTCTLGKKTLKIDLNKKTLLYPGASVSEGRSLTSDIFEWNAVVPAGDVAEKGDYVKARVRFDFRSDSSLYLMVNGENRTQYPQECMPE